MGTLDEIYHQPQTPEVAFCLGRGSLIEVSCGEGGGQTNFGLIKWSGSHCGEKVFLRPEQVKLNLRSYETGVYVRNIQNYGSHQLVEVVSRSSGEPLLSKAETFDNLELNQPVEVDFIGVREPVFFS